MSFKVLQKLIGNFTILGALITFISMVLIKDINFYCKIRICGNEQSYENKKEKIFINQNI